ncbi:uncharacterized protein LOC126183307 [Schistocerca cancellata]|uniref:uncharacterized protein LOC126183307 n=1 Tax=Schistocerca cancellata TaxID=274614 RepID=UPI0021195CBD|nr:uncharacterized protein LOC126183307 [Schistocerca cancellata]
MCCCLPLYSWFLSILALILESFLETYMPSDTTQTLGGKKLIRIIGKLRRKWMQTNIMLTTRLTSTLPAALRSFGVAPSVKRQQLLQQFTDPEDSVATAAARGCHHNTTGQPHPDGAFASSA